MSNIYEHIKMCIFCVLSLVKPTKNVLKLSWNFQKIGSWNFPSCCWEPCCSHRQLLTNIADICCDWLTDQPMDLLLCCDWSSKSSHNPLLCS